MFLTTPSMTWPSSRFCTSSWRCSARVSSRTVRRDTTMLPRRRSILRIWNGCELFISGATSRIGRISTCERGREGAGPTGAAGKAALDLVEDDAVHLLVVVERLLELAPAFLAARLVARQHGFAERILDPVEKHLDLVADLEIAFAAGPCEFAQRHAAFGFQADVDDGDVLLDRNNDALDDGAFLQVAAGKGLVEHGGKIVAGRIIGSSSRSHLFSRCGCRRPFGLRGVSGVKCWGSANPNDRSQRKIATAGRQHVCTFDTLILSGTLNLSISRK